MKKFYVNGKIVYLNNEHNSLSAVFCLRDHGLAGSFDHVVQALDQDQDLLEVPGPDFCEVLVEASSKELQPSIKECAQAALDYFSMEEAVDPDCYVLPNGKSAPYGLSGSELASLKHSDKVWFVSPLQVGGVFEARKGLYKADHLLVAVERDLVFTDRAKAVKAYNAIFGDLYGEV